jgi:hypothetical protein
MKKENKAEHVFSKKHLIKNLGGFKILKCVDICFTFTTVVIQLILNDLAFISHQLNIILQ